MSAGRRYGAWFTAAMMVLVLGVVWAIGGITGDRRREASPARTEGADTFAVKDPALIRPTLDQYAEFASEDSAWRAQHARPETIQRMFAGGEWRPTARQAMQDRVYLLVREGRLEDAIVALENWTARHPEDTDSFRELARLLVAAGLYDDALNHYRLVVSRTGDRNDRSEYAAALLGAKRYADGERELMWLAVIAPRDTAVASMLRAARRSMTPTAAHAQAWVRGAPKDAEYRLALARALVREERFVEAFAAYDTLLAIQPSVAVFREAAGARATAGDSIGNANVLGRAVRFAPTDTALRSQYARALSWAGDRAGAIGEWSRLIDANPADAGSWLERGRVHAWRNELSLAERDLRRAIALRPDYEAWALLGDVYRWRGDFARALSAYAAALALRPNDPVVLASLAEIRQVESAAVVAGAPVSEDRGWVAQSRYAEDNTGFLFLSAGIARGFPVGRQMVFSIGAEQRHLAQRSWRDATRWVRGVAATARLSHTRPGATFALHGGLARHPLVRDMATGGADVTLWWPRARLSANLATGPVYTSLMTTHALVRFAPRTGTAESTTPLVGRTAGAGVAIPIGRAEISGGLEQLRLNDGNHRTSVNLGARVSLTRHVSALYHGSTIAYSESSDLYWDPRRYRSHSGGVEMAVRRATGFSAAARILPGVARSSETFPLALDSSVVFRPRNAPQLSASGELEYRQRRWSAVMAAGYGRGREGGYQALNGTLRVQLAW